MAVDKFSISLPGDLLAELDDLAEADGLTRSAIIREAAADYVATRKSEEYSAQRRERVDRAIGGFRGVSERWGRDERSGVQYLHDLRGETTRDDPETHDARAEDDDDYT